MIWVYGLGDEGVMAFTDFGIENLVELIKMYKDDPSLLNEGTAKVSRPAAHAGCLR